MKRKVSLVLIFLMIFSIIAPMEILATNDIQGHWAEEEIQVAIRNKVVQGYPDGTFRPDDFVSGAEFIKMLIKNLYLGLEDGKEIWYEPYISKAKETLSLDVLKLDYTKKINRKDMAFLLAKAGEIKNRKTKDTNINFSDVKENYVSEAVKMGLLEGYPDGTFRPEKLLTRAEAIVVLERLDKEVNDNSIVGIDNKNNEKPKKAINAQYNKGCEVKIYDEKGDYVRFSYNTEAEPIIYDENTTVYKDAYPDTDVIFLEADNKVKEKFRIKNKLEEALEIEMTIDTNLQFSSTDTKLTFFKDTDVGIRKVYQTEPLFMENKGGDRSYDVKYEKISDNTFKIKIDNEWLDKQKEKDYPVIVDPTFGYYGGSSFIRISDLGKWDSIMLPNGSSYDLAEIDLSKNRATLEPLSDKAEALIADVWRDIRVGSHGLRADTKIVARLNGPRYIVSVDNSGVLKARDLYEGAFVTGKDTSDCTEVESISYETLKLEQEVRHYDFPNGAISGTKSLRGDARARCIIRTTTIWGDQDDDLFIQYAIGEPIDEDNPEPKNYAADSVLYFEEGERLEFRGMHLEKRDGIYFTEVKDPELKRPLRFIIERYTMPENIGDINLKP